MKPCVFIHTNEKQIVGAIVPKYSFERSQIVIYINPIDPDGSGSWFLNSAKQIEQGGFSRSACPKYANQGPFINGKAYVVNCRMTLNKVIGKVLNIK